LLVGSEISSLLACGCYWIEEVSASARQRSRSRPRARGSLVADDTATGCFSLGALDAHVAGLRAARPRARSCTSVLLHHLRQELSTPSGVSGTLDQVARIARKPTRRQVADALRLTPPGSTAPGLAGGPRRTHPGSMQVRPPRPSGRVPPSGRYSVKVLGRIPPPRLLRSIIGVVRRHDVLPSPALPSNSAVPASRCGTASSLAAPRVGRFVNLLQLLSVVRSTHYEAPPPRSAAGSTLRCPLICTRRATFLGHRATAFLSSSDSRRGQPYQAPSITSASSGRPFHSGPV